MWIPCSTSRQLLCSRQKQWNCVVRAQHKGRTGGLPPWQAPALHVAQGILRDVSTLGRTHTRTEQNVFVAGNLVISVLQRSHGWRCRAAGHLYSQPSMFSNYQKGIKLVKPLSRNTTIQARGKVTPYSYSFSRCLL